VSAKRMIKPSRRNDVPQRGRPNLGRLRRMTDREIERSSPPDLADLPDDFWARAEVTVPPKQAISLRLDQDVLEWFRKQGPRYQTRMNAVLRSYVSRAKAGTDGRTLGAKTRHRHRAAR